jgi:hypothetical protein
MVFAKFIQMCKVYPRLRMINLNFGANLGGFFQQSADHYDEASTKGLDYIINSTRGNKGKFDKYEMQLNFFEFFGFKLVLYLVSFFLKFIAEAYLMSRYHNGKISKSTCHWINLH